MNENKKEKTYNARILYNEETGTIKIIKAEERKPINQFRYQWRPARSREVARLINRNKIIIK